MTKGEAIVVKNAGSHFVLGLLPQWELFPAVLRGRVRLNASSATNPIAVGDRVEFEYDETPSEKHPAQITSILARKNHIVRKSTNLSRQSHVIAANLDRVFLVTTLFFPEVKLPFLDRQLVTCEMYKIPVTIVLNKVDLYRDEASEQVEYFKSIYMRAGYNVVETSAKTKEGIDTLRKLCHGQGNSLGINLISGESGVGKSSLIKAIDPSLDPKIGDISIAHLQGKHTTSLYEMYPISTGGYIIDTPGLRAFGLQGLEKEEVYTYFPEMLEVSRHCRFTPCSHTHEPGCAVKEAVERGEIAPERYNSYIGMLEEDGKFR